jgi:hypothetical protein
VINYRHASFLQGYKDDNPYTNSENAATAAYLAAGGKEWPGGKGHSNWGGAVQSRRMHEMHKRSGYRDWNGLD